MGLNTQQTITQSNNLIQLNSHNLEYHNGNYHYTRRYHPMWYFANLLYHLSIEIPYHKIIIIIIVGGTNLFPIRYCPLWEWAKSRYHPHGFVQSHIGEESLLDMGLNKSMRVASALGPFPKRTIPDWRKIRPSHNNSKCWY